MKFYILLFAVLTLVSVNGYFYAAPALRKLPQVNVHRANIDDSTPTQYYERDDLGQYSYGYNGPLSAKQEVRTLDGVTRGSYSYLDGEGKIQHVAYIADAGGFRVAATNLPQLLPVAEEQLPKPVQDTPEVAAARAQHLAAHKEAIARTSAVASFRNQNFLESAGSVAILPSPVEDTAEVAAAKVAFFERYEQENLRHKLLRINAAETLKLQPSVTVLSLPGYKLGTPHPKNAYLPLV